MKIRIKPRRIVYPTVQILPFAIPARSQRSSPSFMVPGPTVSFWVVEHLSGFNEVDSPDPLRQLALFAIEVLIKAHSRIYHKTPL